LCIKLRSTVALWSVVLFFGFTALGARIIANRKKKEDKPSVTDEKQS